MTRRPILVVSAGGVLASWGICVLGFATGSGAHNWPLLVLFAAVALAVTACAAILILLSWDAEAPVISAVPAAVLATAATLFLAVLIRSGG